MIVKSFGFYFFLPGEESTTCLWPPRCPTMEVSNRAICSILPRQVFDPVLDILMTRDGKSLWKDLFLLLTKGGRPDPRGLHQADAQLHDSHPDRPEQNVQVSNPSFTTWRRSKWSIINRSNWLWHNENSTTPRTASFLSAISLYHKLRNNTNCKGHRRHQGQGRDLDSRLEAALASSQH